MDRQLIQCALLEPGTYTSAVERAIFGPARALDVEFKQCGHIHPGNIRILGPELLPSRRPDHTEGIPPVLLAPARQGGRARRIIIPHRPELDEYS